MDPKTQQAIDLIKGRLDEIESERKQLERGLVSFGKKERQTRVRRGQAASRGRRRAPRGARQAQLLDAVASRPGRKPSEYAKDMGVPPQQVYSLISRLSKDGKISKDDGGLRVAGSSRS